MANLFASGHIVELILIGVVVEAVVLAVLFRSRRTTLLVNLLSGAALLLALRAALENAAWPWIALWLLAALVAHVGDMFFRLRATER